MRVRSSGRGHRTPSPARLAPGGMCAQFARGAEERGGLSIDHRKILFARYVRGGFKTNVVALPRAHSQVRIVQHLHHRVDTMRRQLRGISQQREIRDGAHRVARIDPVRDAIARPNRFGAMTQLVAILDIVVDERIIVQALDADCGVDGRFERPSFFECGAEE